MFSVAGIVTDLGLRDILLLLIGILFGGGMQLAVQRLTTRWRRRDVKKALLGEVTSIAQVAAWGACDVRKLLLPATKKEKRSKWGAPQLQTPVWGGYCSQVHLIPPKDLPKLQRFYDRVSLAQYTMGVVESQFEQWHASAGPDEPLNLAANLERLAKQYDELASLGNAYRLEEDKRRT